MSVEHVDKTVQQILAAQSADMIRNKVNGSEVKLLPDMESDYPALRLHLLGYSSDTSRVHSGSLSLSRVEQAIRLRLHKPVLQYQALFQGKSLFGLLELAEQALQEGSHCWEPDFQLVRRRRREEERELT